MAAVRCRESSARVVALQRPCPTEKPIVCRNQGRTLPDSRCQDDSIRRVALEPLQLRRLDSSCAVDGKFQQSGAQQFLAPSGKIEGSAYATFCGQHCHFPERDRADSDRTFLERRLSASARLIAQAVALLVEPQQHVSIQQDHSVAFQVTSMGDSMSPERSIKPW